MTIVSTLPPMDLKFLCTDARCCLSATWAIYLTIPVIWDSEGNEIPEGILDGVMTARDCPHDLKVQKNSRALAASIL